MTGLAHVLSPEGGWLGFEAFDPAAVDAVKALLDTGIPSNACAESGSFSCTTENEVAPALVEQPGARTRPTQEVTP